MKHLLLTTIAAVLVVGCGPKPPTAKAPDISIHDAAYEGNIEAVKQAIADGADANTKDDDGRTPLHYAANEGHMKIAGLLISKGADLNAKDKIRGTPLHYAAAYEHKEIVELIIAADADLKAKDEEGATPLHNAAFIGNKEIAQLLIAKGANVNAKDDVGDTPLDFAEDIRAALGFKYILSAKKEVASILRKHGGKTGDELKAVDKAIKPVAESAQPEPPTGKTPDASLWEAAMFGGIELAKKAIADGADVNAKKEDGQTPLHSAVVAALDSGDNKVIELLIENGADVNAKIVSGRHQGMTPLDAANVVAKFSPLPTTVKNLSNITALLRKHGGKTGEELKAERALFNAARKGSINTVRQHLAAGTDVNAKDKFRSTPLHLARTKEIAELLIAKGADVNAKDAIGKTPLDWAIKDRRTFVGHLLHYKHGGKTGEELKAEGK
jgi:ankyrin repeat protein